MDVIYKTLPGRDAQGNAGQKSEPEEKQKKQKRDERRKKESSTRRRREKHGEIRGQALVVAVLHGLPQCNTMSSVVEF